MLPPRTMQAQQANICANASGILDACDSSDDEVFKKPRGSSVSLSSKKSSSKKSASISSQKPQQDPLIHGNSIHAISVREKLKDADMPMSILNKQIMQFMPFRKKTEMCSVKCSHDANCPENTMHWHSLMTGKLYVREREAAKHARQCITELQMEAKKNTAMQLKGAKAPKIRGRAANMQAAKLASASVTPSAKSSTPGVLHQLDAINISAVSPIPEITADSDTSAMVSPDRSIGQPGLLQDLSLTVTLRRGDGTVEYDVNMPASACNAEFLLPFLNGNPCVLPTPSQTSSIASPNAQCCTEVGNGHAVDSILRSVFRHGTDSHTLLRIKMALGAEATASIRISNAAITELIRLFPEAGGNGSKRTVHYGKTIATNCQLQQRCRITGAVQPATIQHMDGGEDADLTAIRKVLKAEVLIGLHDSTGRTWAPHGYKACRERERRLTGVDISGPFAVRVQRYKKIDGTVSGPNELELNASLILHLRCHSVMHRTQLDLFLRAVSPDSE